MHVNRASSEYEYHTLMIAPPSVYPCVRELCDARGRDVWAVSSVWIRTCVMWRTCATGTCLFASRRKDAEVYKKVFTFFLFLNLPESIVRLVFYLSGTAQYLQAKLKRKKNSEYYYGSSFSGVVCGRECGWHWYTRMWEMCKAETLFEQRQYGRHLKIRLQCAHCSRRNIHRRWCTSPAAERIRIVSTYVFRWVGISLFLPIQFTSSSCLVLSILIECVPLIIFSSCKCCPNFGFTRKITLHLWCCTHILH